MDREPRKPDTGRMMADVDQGMAELPFRGKFSTWRSRTKEWRRRGGANGEKHIN
jgi:hypothetical protein